MADKIKKTVDSLDPELYKEAKKMAVDQGITIGEVFNRLIAQEIARTRDK